MPESDDLLMRLFAEERVSRGGEEFVANIAARIGRARVRGRLARIAVLAALAALAAAATPYVAEGSLALASRLANGLPVLGDALASPAGWAASALIALWSLRRLQILGR